MRAIIFFFAVMFVLPSLHAQENKEYLGEARRFINKMGLKEENIYYVSKRDMQARYFTQSKKLEFPNNHIFGSDGEEMRLKNEIGSIWQPLSNLKSFVDDIDKFFVDTSHRRVFDGGSFDWVKQYVKPVFTNNVTPLSEYNIVLYYPMGTPLIKKYYNRLLERIRYYMENGKNINVYFVMVPMWEDTSTDGKF